MKNQQGAPEALTDFEHRHAIRQGYEIAASDGYFEARPQIDSSDRRKAFQAGFERGWDRHAALVDAQQPAPSAAGDVFDEPDEVIKLRALAATCYAGLGAECNLPENWLDALNAAANGEPFTTSGLLPYKAQPSPTPQADSQPAPATQQARKSVAIQWLAEMIMSDCGCSTQNQRLLDRIIERITQYERANTSTQSEGAQAPMIDAEATAYNEWFNGEQGTAYYGMWEFARAAWMARAARAPADGALEDTARYEYLRDCTMGERSRLEHYSGPALDVVIDAARKQGGQHGAE